VWNVFCEPADAREMKSLFGEKGFEVVDAEVTEFNQKLLQNDDQFAVSKVGATQQEVLAICRYVDPFVAVWPGDYQGGHEKPPRYSWGAPGLPQESS